MPVDRRAVTETGSGKEGGNPFQFLVIAAGFWSGPTRRTAWIATGIALFFLFANLGSSIAYNLWYKYFFDALQQKESKSVVFGIGLVFIVALASSAGSVGLLHGRMRLQLRWREWLTNALTARWLADRHFYQLTIAQTQADNPEARLTEDVRLSIDLLVDFSLGVLNALLAAVSFIGILWAVGGSFSVAGMTIPGYMVLACIVYSGLTTTITFLLGRPLVRRVEEKATGEARFRYEVTRVRENAENISLIGGDEDERARLATTFSDLVKRWLAVITWQGRMMWLNGANMVLAPVIPLLLGAPKYLSGEMTLGSLMQAAAAFTQVQLALNWLADNAMRLADWFASARRVAQLSEAIDHLDNTLGPIRQGDTIKLGTSPDNCVHIRHVKIAQHDGTLMIEGAEAVIAPGEKVLVKGDSGTGKSTLIRAMAGLWPWGSGEILKPEGARIAFLPQRPYFPLGTLRSALLYPVNGHDVDDKKVEDMLMRCGLEHLIRRLDEVEQWGSVLSGGEQQRFAFARVLINPPDILIMDEPTASLDELSEFRMMEYMRDLLGATMVIHAGHRPGLERFHDREIHLVRDKSDGPATTRERRFSPRELIARAMRGFGGRRQTTRNANRVPHAPSGH